VRGGTRMFAYHNAESLGGVDCQCAYASSGGCPSHRRSVHKPIWVPIRRRFLRSVGSVITELEHEVSIGVAFVPSNLKCRVPRFAPVLFGRLPFSFAHGRLWDKKHSFTSPARFGFSIACCPLFFHLNHSDFPQRPQSPRHWPLTIS
jgi:hypothetical protein